MKTLTFPRLALICIVFATTTQAQVAPEQARNFQINDTHTESISTEHLTPSLRQRCVVNFGRSISYPLIAGGRVYVTVPPTLTGGNQTPAANAAGWNNTPVDVAITTDDDLSGVQSSDPASPLHCASEGANQTQQVTVTDKAGNSATYTSPAVNIDLAVPATGAVISGNAEWNTSLVSVTLHASDNLSGVASTFYRIDGGAAQTYASTFSLTAGGVHSVEFWSVDVAGNAEAHRTRTVKIDSTAPVTQASASGTAGTSGWYRSAVQVMLGVSDNVSDVQTTSYRIDGGTLQTYVGPFVLSSLGQHTVEYSSVDYAGNAEATHSLVVKIDTNGKLGICDNNVADQLRSGCKLFQEGCSSFARQDG